MWRACWKKLRLHNRVELSLYAIGDGLHDPSPPERPDADAPGS